MSKTDTSPETDGDGRSPAPGGNGDFEVGALFRSDATRKKFLGAFIEYLGGPEVLRWMQKHYGEGYSYYQIGEWANKAPSTVRHRVRKAAEIMKRHDLFPERWSRIDQQQKAERSRKPKSKKRS